MARPFDYTAEYKRKLCTADEAARVVKSGDWIDISMGTGFPSLMDAAIAKRKDELREVKIRGYLIFDPIQMVECDPERRHFVYNSWHMSGYERKLCDRGLCNFNPMVFRNLSWYYSQFLTVNVAMMAVTPMNEHGYFNVEIAVLVHGGHSHHSHVDGEELAVIPAEVAEHHRVEITQSTVAELALIAGHMPAVVDKVPALGVALHHLDRVEDQIAADLDLAKLILSLGNGGVHQRRKARAHGDVDPVAAFYHPCRFIGGA